MPNLAPTQCRRSRRENRGRGHGAGRCRHLVQRSNGSSDIEHKSFFQGRIFKWFRCSTFWLLQRRLGTEALAPTLSRPSCRWNCRELRPTWSFPPHGSANRDPTRGGPLRVTSRNTRGQQITSAPPPEGDLSETRQICRDGPTRDIACILWPIIWVKASRSRAEAKVNTTILVVFLLANATAASRRRACVRSG